MASQVKLAAAEADAAAAKKQASAEGGAAGEVKAAEAKLARASSTIHRLQAEVRLSCLCSSYCFIICNSQCNTGCQAAGQCLRRHRAHAGRHEVWFLPPDQHGSWHSGRALFIVSACDAPQLAQQNTALVVCRCGSMMRWSMQQMPASPG